ncbi:unnamed protein product [Taenia asiatica]|uniref:Secreted protein n=1 Tax=Taenia asiatica TaxID=60517 RepID=A0A0R3W8J7_TAEAS|nr:unnamed protein product [Taenia asiatica]
MVRGLVYVVAAASCILVYFEQINGRLIVNEDLQCDDRGCKIRAAVDDYVRIERELDFGIQVMQEFIDYVFNAAMALADWRLIVLGSTFLKISGDFNRKDVTRLVLSKGQMDATLLIHRANGGGNHKRERRILYTTPPVLTIEENYTISRPVQITVPYFSDSLPKCVAYFGLAKVEGVLSADDSGDSEQGGVHLKWTGSKFWDNRSEHASQGHTFPIAGRSSIKIHGKVIQVPFEITFLGEKEKGEEYTFAFLSSPSQKCNLLLTFISVLGTVAYAQ